MNKLIFLLAAIFTLNLSASTINSDCATCAGAAYDISYLPVSSGGGVDVVDVKITAILDTYTGGGDKLSAIAVKVASSIIGFDLISAPLNSGTWTEVAGGLNSNGCSGAGSGDACAESLAVGAAVANTPLEFVFRISMITGSLFTGEGEASLKVLYTLASKHAGPNLSEKFTLIPDVPDTSVPEPSTFFSLAAGLIGFAAIRRRTT